MRQRLTAIKLNPAVERPCMEDLGKHCSSLDASNEGEVVYMNLD